MYTELANSLNPASDSSEEKTTRSSCWDSVPGTTDSWTCNHTPTKISLIPSRLCPCRPRKPGSGEHPADMSQLQHVEEDSLARGPPPPPPHTHTHFSPCRPSSIRPSAGTGENKKQLDWPFRPDCLCDQRMIKRGREEPHVQWWWWSVA